MSPYHDPNYHRRWRIIGRWALVTFMSIMMLAGLFRVLYLASVQYPSLGLSFDKTMTPFVIVALVLFVLVFRAIDLSRRLEDFDKKVLAGEKVEADPETQKDGEYHFILPAGISATEEVQMRFGNDDFRDPIASLMIRAGYGQFIYWVMWDAEEQAKQKWALAHTRDWTRYDFRRWKELREEISSGIKKRVGDELEMKKYICSLITPFQELSHFSFGDSSDPLIKEADAFIHSFADNFYLPSDEFIPIWKELVNEMRAEEESQSYTIEDYNDRMHDKLIDVIEEDTLVQNEEVRAIETFMLFPQDYTALIAGCLMENGVQKEYLDYQDMCGVQLVKKIYSSDVASIMNWTEELVYSYGPKRVTYIGISINKEGENSSNPKSEYYEYTGYDVGDRAAEYLQAITEQLIAKTGGLKRRDTENTTVHVSFGDITKLPPEFRDRKAAEIWEKAHAADLIDDNFHFKGKQVEKALFAGYLSEALFGKLDWVAMCKWDNYKYYSQKYSIATDKTPSEQTPREKLIVGLFKES